MIRKDMRFDVRTIPHRLRRQELTPQDVDAHLSDLPDDAEEAETTEVQFTRHFEERHSQAKSEQS